jgi:endo-1,3(4)-beta-glucanase
MLPLNPSSGYTRQNLRARRVGRSIGQHRCDRRRRLERDLYANLALIDPVASYKFFAAPDFDYTHLDRGASRTWYLAYAAGLGGRCRGMQFFDELVVR